MAPWPPMQPDRGLGGGSEDLSTKALHGVHLLTGHLPRLDHWAPKMGGCDPFGYGSIPINSILSGMNIHKSQLF